MININRSTTLNIQNSSFRVSRVIATISQLGGDTLILDSTTSNNVIVSRTSIRVSTQYNNVNNNPVRVILNITLSTRDTECPYQLELPEEEVEEFLSDPIQLTRTRVCPANYTATPAQLVISIPKGGGITLPGNLIVPPFTSFISVNEANQLRNQWIEQNIVQSYINTQINCVCNSTTTGGITNQRFEISAPIGWGTGIRNYNIPNINPIAVNFHFRTNANTYVRFSRQYPVGWGNNTAVITDIGNQLISFVQNPSNNIINRTDYIMNITTINQGPSSSGAEVYLAYTKPDPLINTLIFRDSTTCDNSPITIPISIPMSDPLANFAAQQSSYCGIPPQPGQSPAPGVLRWAVFSQQPACQPNQTIPTCNDSTQVFNLLTLSGSIRARRTRDFDANGNPLTNPTPPELTGLILTRNDGGNFLTDLNISQQLANDINNVDNPGYPTPFSRSLQGLSVQVCDLRYISRFASFPLSWETTSSASYIFELSPTRIQILGNLSGFADGFDIANATVIFRFNSNVVSTRPIPFNNQFNRNTKIGTRCCTQNI